MQPSLLPDPALQARLCGAEEQTGQPHEAVPAPLQSLVGNFLPCPNRHVRVCIRKVLNSDPAR